MSFFAVPLSGLTASQQQLQAISNNLANLDTVGYKDENVSFADIFAQNSISNGANDPLQVGLGTSTAATTSDFTSGTVSSTGVASNMALQGNGFFVVQSAAGTISYERAGDFTANSDGQMVDPSGNLVLGYPAVNGVVNTSAALTPLNVGTGSASPAAASSTFSMPTNLSADASTGSGSAFTSNVTLYDSLGNSIPLEVTFQKTAANTWSYSATVPDSSLAAGGTGTSQVASGSLVFDSAGALSATLTSSGASTTPTITNPVIDIPALADGSASMSSVSWDLTDTAAAITQNSTASAQSKSATQNGYAAGTLSSYSVNSNGTVEGTYSNGQTMALGQVALANFTNTQGLAQTGNNLYQSTSGSGQAQIGIAGTGGLGTITGGSIEASNVDTATEFAKMIVAQQAYQANAKAVTTLDQVSQATLQMISS